MVKNTVIRMRVLRSGPTTSRISADRELYQVLKEFYQHYKIDIKVLDMVNKGVVTRDEFQFTNEVGHTPLYDLLSREKRLPLFEAYLLKYNIHLDWDPIVN